MMHAHCSHPRLQASQVRFVADGDCAALKDAAETLGPEESDLIDVASEQTGEPAENSEGSDDSDQ